jgi:WD40 repeat protein
MIGWVAFFEKLLFYCQKTKGDTMKMLFFLFIFILTIPVLTNADDPNLIWETQCRESGYRDIEKVMFIPPGDRIICNCEDSLQIRDALTGEQIGDCFGFINIDIIKEFDMDVSQDGKYVVFNSTKDGSQIWDIEKREPIIKFRDHIEGIGPIGLGFSPDGKIVYALNDVYNQTYNGRIWKIDANTGEVLKHIGIGVGFKLLEVSPCGRYVAAATNGAIYLYDAETLSSIGTLNINSTYIVDLRFSNDGNLISSANISNISVWDVLSHEKLFYNDEYTYYYSIDFSLDSKKIIFSYQDFHSVNNREYFAEIMNLENNTLIHKYPYIIESIHISPDETMIVSSFNKNIYMYDAIWEPSFVSNLDKSEIIISPISGKDLIEIQYDKKILSLEIIDMSGKIIKTYNENEIKGGDPYQIDISNIPNGTYILQINAIGKVISEKIMVGR